MEQITLLRPDDWHLHLRDGAQLKDVVAFSARQFGRAIIMPNLKPPVTTTEMALAYRERIVAALPEGSGFEPLMTLYLTDNTSPEEIRKARDSGKVHAVKLYPAGATTNSDAGVTDLARCEDALAMMTEIGMPLCVHGEATGDAIDIFDLETRFIDEVLAPLAERHSTLKIIFEHITTAAAADFVKSSRDGIAATITPQHLLYNRNAIFKGGIRPHYYCLPILKTERDREALIDAATSGNPKFFLGTDSAPHARHSKETACGCAGCFTAHAAIELYAEAFDAAGRLDQLEDFASRFGAAFYGLPEHVETITLRREAWTPPAAYPFGDTEIVPFRADEHVAWRMIS